MNWYELDEVLSKAELPDIARRLGMDVEQRGVNLVAKCPFHADTRPSLVLYPSEGSNPSHFHCFSCNAHGFAVDLVKQVHGEEFKPAIEWIARSLGIAPKRSYSGKSETEKSTREEAFTFALKVFDQWHDEKGFVDWCRSRRFDRDFLYNQGLRCLPVGSGLVRALDAESFGRQQALIDGLESAGLLTRLRPEVKLGPQGKLNLREQFRDYFHDGRILIPIRAADNKIVAFSGRYRPGKEPNSKADGETAKYLLTPGFRKAEVLFNVHQARQVIRASVKAGNHSPVLYVVEGFLDALRLQALNLPTVAVMGSSLSDKQRDGLVGLVETENLPGGTHLRLRLFFDRDSAGFDGAIRAARQLLGLLGVAIEWIGFAESDKALPGKDPDEMLMQLDAVDASIKLNQLAAPALAILVAAGLGYKDATPLQNDRWNDISRYPRERALLQAARALRALSGATADWVQRLESLVEPHPAWVVDLLQLLKPQQKGGLGAKRPSQFGFAFLRDLEPRLNHARMLAEHGSRRGELPCDDETWRALDRNAQLFNKLALDRLREPAWHQVAPCDAVHLPRKLTDDEKVLSDPRRKVMPHTADLHLQQFLINELLTERHDFSHSGPWTFSDCIPAVRWFGTEREVRVTGYVDDGEPNPALPNGARSDHDEPTLSFAYQIDMEVLEGRRKPSDQGMFRPYMECWRGFMDSLTRQAQAIGPYVHVLRLDAKRYYDAIQRYVVRDRLLGPMVQALTISGPEEMASLLDLNTTDVREVAKQLVDLLCGSLFDHEYRHPDDGSSRRSDEVIGIPQGPVISAWIGTIAMFPVDAAARSFMRQPEQRRRDDPSRPRVGYARYVDDIVLLASSEAGLHALREVIQEAAARLELTLVRKGDPVAPGTPESVMRQLNSGRVLAASVPAWEPPMVGDGETGWGMGADDVAAMDRQSALHLLRHPSLLENSATVHEKVRDAMRAPDLRPSDLGKCARALWWQVAAQSVERDAAVGGDAWASLWQAYRERWNDVSNGQKWHRPFDRRGDDILFAVEGLDMLMDSTFHMETRRPQYWIDHHRMALDALAKAFLQSKDVLQGAPLTHNRAHIMRRLTKVQWKALQRDSGLSANWYREPQLSNDPTLTDWLCQAAMSLRRYRTDGDPAAPPLEKLPDPPDSPRFRGPIVVQTACRYLKAAVASGRPRFANPDADAIKIALPFLVANTTEQFRWGVLKYYPDTLADGLRDLPRLTILPPIPVSNAGMLAYSTDDSKPGIHLVAFRHNNNDAPPALAPGAELLDAGVAAVDSIPIRWNPADEMTPGLYRWSSSEKPIRLAFGKVRPGNRARFAADLYEVLRAIQCQEAGNDREWVTIMDHLAHEPASDDIIEVPGTRWHLVSEPVPTSQLGVSAWVRDGRGGLRSISVPGGEYAKFWRLGCAVSDALDMAFELPKETNPAEETENSLSHPSQIEDYVLRQQLSKLRGTWIADAQVQDEGPDGLPRSIRRALEILHFFDPMLAAAEQVKLVLRAEAETRSMAMRLQRKGPSDLRDRLHLLPASVLQRLPLNVLEWLQLPNTHADAPLRTDLALLLALAESLDSEHLDASAEASGKRGLPGPAHALYMGVVLAAAGVALRGLVASAWGVERFRSPATLPENLPVPAGWNAPEAGRQDPQKDYETMRKGLREDEWADLKEASPWQWMLALLGILDGLAPQVLESPGDNPLRDVYEHLRQWQSARPEEASSREWAWPYDDIPTYEVAAWRSLRAALPKATTYVDGKLGLIVRQVEAPLFRRHRDDLGFTDAGGQQWMLKNLQYTGLGLGDSVARVQRGSRRLPTWTEVRRRADDGLLSVHSLDEKLGRWLHGRVSAIAEPMEQVAEQPVATPSAPEVPSGASTTPPADGLKAGPKESIGPRNLHETSSLDIRESQFASWRGRGRLKNPSHMRVALLQWFIDESYSHPLAEVGLQGMRMKERSRATIRKALVATSEMAAAEKAAVRGKEHTWAAKDAVSVPSWPEHRRRRILKRALEACESLCVDLLVLPEVSVRPDTVEWLKEELQRHYPGLAVLAGTYRHFGRPVDDESGGSIAGGIHPLMAPITLLWRPDLELSKVFFSDSNGSNSVLRFTRGKKYRAVAARELFHPHWQTLQPLFRIDPLLEQLVGNRELPLERQKSLLRAIGAQMPKLRYCMELICSELFVLTSPANLGPLRQELLAMLNRFPKASSDTAEEIVRADYEAVGDALSVLQENSTPRRTILLVPAATKRSNDYWHAGQASVLASGTATVFCNAAESSFSCGGSCFIGIDSATKPHGSSVGFIETLTPYHGWRKGILTARTDGALSGSDQALVVVDLDPVHVVTAKPRPQLLPEPMALVAYLPIVELLDRDANKVALHQALSAGGFPHIDAAVDPQGVQRALKNVATQPLSSNVVSPTDLWSAFRGLLNADAIDGAELDTFAELFRDPKAVQDRLLAWERDRDQQPHTAPGPLGLEPAWLDFLEADLTLKEDEPLATIKVHPWIPDSGKLDEGDEATDRIEPKLASSRARRRRRKIDS